MKAAITDGSGHLFISTAPEPKVEDYTCLCQILAASSCSGTDQKIINGALPWKETYPGILGHESVGRVIEIGKRVRHIKAGDIFLRPTAVYPGDKLGGFTSLWGGFAEYGLVTDTQAIAEDRADITPNPYTVFQQKIPSGIAPAEATMLITLKECASFMAKLDIRLHTSLAILGSGPVAAGMVYFAKLLGAFPVVAIGRRDEPLQRMRDVGADATINCLTEDMGKSVREITSGKGVEVIVDCAGDSGLISSASRLLAVNGRIAPYAVGHDFTYTLDRNIGSESWKFIFTQPSENLAHQYVLDLHRLHALPLGSFYSHRLPFSQIAEGFDLLKKKEAFKIVFEMN